MSEPVTNVEIEDVLSSIRRLVSQDGTDRGAAKDASGQADALVLTEDHRVDENGGNAPAEGGDMRQRAAKTVRSELEKAIEELEATMGIEPEPEPSTPEQPSTPTAAPARDVEEAVDAVLANVAERSEAIAEEVAETVSHREPTEDQKASVETAAELPGGDKAEADDIDWDAPVGQAMDGAPPSVSPSGDVEVQPVEASTDEVAEPEIVDASETEASVLNAIRIVSHAADDAEQNYDEQYEGDVLKDAQIDIVEGDEGSDGPIEEMEPAETPSEAAFEGTDQEEEDVSEPLTAAEPPYAEVAIDEEMLRDMVAQIVRNELQGELGERITRNVRKLVRREINRALAGQDLI